MPHQHTQRRGRKKGGVHSVSDGNVHLFKETKQNERGDVNVGPSSEASNSGSLRCSGFRKKKEEETRLRKVGLQM